MGDYLDHPFMTLSTIIYLTLHISPNYLDHPFIMELLHISLIL